MHIDSIHLKNFRRFEKADFSFARRFNLIVGENATGKTAILDGLAVALGGLLLNLPGPAKSRSIKRDEVRLGFFSHGDAYTAEPQYPVRVACHGEVAGELGEWHRDLTSAEGRTTRQDLAWIRHMADSLRESVKAGTDVFLPVLSYYGTGRLWVQKRHTEVSTLKPQSRFAGYRSCLNPASDEKRLLQWFKTNELSALQRKEPNATLEACRHAVLSCVPEATNVHFDVARDELVLRVDEQELPFHYLSDGFRNVVAMVADIAVRCASLNPALGEEAPTKTPGVVLIDELDLHLHPKWQRRVVTDLLRAFPKVQFIGTTHSPFIIQSLPPKDVIELINLDDPEADEFANKSVEDITEEVQGVELPQRSLRYRRMMAAAEEYYKCLGQASSANAEELKELQQRLDELSRPFGDDPAYQAFLKVQRAASGIEAEGQE